MPHRKAISVQINDHARFVTFKLRGLVYGPQLLEVTHQVYAGLSEPWRYNRLYDLRALINVLQPEDFVALIEQWGALAGPQAAMRTAIVTDDAIRIARLQAFAPLFPDVKLRLFDTLAAAIEWLIDSPATDQAVA